MSENLSPSQRKAIEIGGQITLISAGPGTGKTHTLISRILHLLNKQKIPPEKICAVTFTKKAAAELAERLQISTCLHMPFIGTIHAFASYLLTESERTFSLLSDKDRAEIFKSMSQEGMKDVALHISRQKNRACGGVCDPVVRKYNDFVTAKNKLDFEDLILQAIDLLKSAEGKAISEKFSHILVDEFQDTSELQYEFLKLFLQTGSSLFAIGDPFQSIYGFRGAGSDTFRKVISEFPSVNSLSLEENFRSVPQIVRCAEGLFPEKKPLVPYRKDEGCVHIIETLDEKTEASFILREVNSYLGGTDLLTAAGHSFIEPIRMSEIAVVYRAHYLRRPILRLFSDCGIPCQVIGEGSPFLQPDIQFMISCMRAIADPLHFSNVDFSRLDAVPTSLVEKVITDCRVQKLKTGEIIDRIIHTCKLELIEKADGERKYDWLQFRQIFLPFDSYDDGLQRSLAHFDYLSAREYYDPAVDKVTLLTIHAAKGLEFKVVFIVGFEEGIIPSLGTKTHPADIEEEKRLLYVAATRARDHLIFTRTRNRNVRTAKHSRFTRLIATSAEVISDPESPRIEQRRIRERDKRSQMKLF